MAADDDQVALFLVMWNATEKSAFSNGSVIEPLEFPGKCCGTIKVEWVFWGVSFGVCCPAGLFRLAHEAPLSWLEAAWCKKGRVGASMKNDVFPLRLTDFEDYAYRDDSPEHPMVITLRIIVEGTLNQVAFRQALETAITENPLLRSVIRSGWRGNSWHLLTDWEPPLTVEHFSDDTLPLACPQRSFDLKQEPGAWFDLRVSPGRSVLVACFHHACCDGIGSIRFIGDIFAHYGQLTARTDDQRPKIRVVDPPCLKLRGSRRMPGNCVDRRAPLLHTLLEVT